MTKVIQWHRTFAFFANAVIMDKGDCLIFSI